MAPHVVAPYDPWICYQWCLIWIVVAGVPIALSTALPPWPKLDDVKKSQGQSQSQH